MKKLPLLATLCLIPAALCIASCREKGPAERAGEDLDEAVGNSGGVLDRDGPAEDAGEEIDDAVDD